MSINFEGFNYSLKNHQELVNIIRDMIENGETNFSKKTLASKIGKSPSWINLAIDKINREEICIEYSSGGLTLNYTDLLHTGVFARIYLMLKDTETNPKLLNKDNLFLSEKYNVSIKTVQMYRAYALY